MADQLVNPITAAFDLLDRYRALVADNLSGAGMSPEDVAAVLASLQVDHGLYLSLNRAFRPGRTGFRQFCVEHGLAPSLPERFPRLKQLHAHQEAAILSILAGHTTIISTGTGSGKTEAFLLSVLNYCLQNPGPGIKALIVYPMNALANDQLRRLREAAGISPPLRVGLYVGSTGEHERQALVAEPPDVLITNHVMLDRLLTRTGERQMLAATRTLRHVVLDEIHTYRGNRAAHLSHLLARLKDLLGHAPVCIGTSATLQSPQIPGYLPNDTGRRDAFIKPLLGVSEYTLVEPEYAPEPPELFEDGTPIPLPQTDLKTLGWLLRLDPEMGLVHLSRLIGRSFSRFDLAGRFSESAPYQAVARHPVVRELRQALLGGPQSLMDLARHVARRLEPGYPENAPQVLVRAWLSAIAFANEMARSDGPDDDPESPPILDFRLHLFVSDLGGYLRRCLTCRRYVSGRREYCPDCGYPVFAVFREDVRLCTGKVNGGRLRWELQPASDDRPDAHYVLISVEDGSPPGDPLRFRERLVASEDELLLDFDVFGRLRLSLLSAPDYSQVIPLLVPLTLERGNLHYLSQLVTALLDFQPGPRPKLLAFSDNREEVSRYAVVLQDMFASRFFEAYWALNHSPGWSLNPTSLLELLHEQAPPDDQALPLEQELFRELALWFYRFLGTPLNVQPERRHLLTLREPEAFSDLERLVLGLFIAERAIVKPPFNDARPTRFIRLEKCRAMDRRGFHLLPGEQSALPGYASLSLSADAREYADLIAQQGPERIAQVVRELVARDVLTGDATPDGKIHYYLRPEWVLVSPPEEPSAQRLTYSALRDRWLRTARVHSAELRAPERQAVEGAFQAGELNCLIATPTLEMGVDIGQLQTILLIGVPPLPSNYAQRAGRAGRGRGGNYALIVTFCREYDAHDAYYFERPRLMVNGVIAPPAFDPANPSVIRQHVNAWALAEAVDTAHSLIEFEAALTERLPLLRARVGDIFGTAGSAYLAGEFAPAFTEAMVAWREAGRPAPREFFYGNGFFPDHNFRRDAVYVLDAAGWHDREPTQRALAEESLSSREAELAYVKLVPGERTYMAGEVYDLTSQGRFDVVRLPGWSGARRYHYLLAEQQVRYASRDRPLRKYARQRLFENQASFEDWQRVLAIAYDQSCTLYFANRGCRVPGEIKPFTDADHSPFSLVYPITRPVLLLRFDRVVSGDPRLYASFTSALDRVMKDVYGLDESEIGLQFDLEPLQPTPEDGRWLYVGWYDAAGSGSVPLARIYGEWRELLARTHERLSICAGSHDQPCQDGCPLCLRSRPTQGFADQLSKAAALMYLGYLLGYNRFEPAIAPPAPPAQSPDLILSLRRSGELFAVLAEGGQCYEASVGSDSQNAVIFNLLCQAVQAEYRPGMRSILIRAGETYIVDAINHGQLKRGRVELARLQFQFLRFRSVRAELG